MAFCIISTIMSGFAGIFFLISMFWFGGLCASIWREFLNCKLGIAVNLISMILMMVEFVISIIAAVKTCSTGGCGGGTRGAILVQPQTQMVQMQQIPVQTMQTVNNE